MRCKLFLAEWFIFLLYKPTKTVGKMDLIHYSLKENEMKTDGGVMTNETKKYAETYGGMAGAVLPLIIMMGTMIFMVAFGMRSTKNFWSAGYFAVLAGFLVYKDKKAFQKALIDGVRDNIFAFMSGFGGRVMGDAKPKYLNSPETIIFDKSRNLYGLNRARKSRKPYFLLCEGYMDVISLHQAGFTNAVASLGTALTPGHAALIKRYVNEVYLTYDSDEAGTKAALRAGPILREVGITAKIIRMEPYKDPDEFIKNLGAEAFEERIQKARNGFMFSLEILERDYDMTSPEGRTDFMKEAARKLTEFDEEIERNNYIDAVAGAYHVGREDLRKLVGRMAVQTGLAKPVERPRSTRSQNLDKEDGTRKSQKILLTWMASDENVFAQIQKYIHPEDFQEGIYRTVAELLYAQHEQGKLNPAQIMNHFTDEEEHREVAALFNTRIREIKTAHEQEKALKETIIRVKKNSIEERSAKLDPTDIQGLQKLMEAKRALQDLEKLHISIN